MKNNIKIGLLTSVTDTVEKKIIAYIIPITTIEQEKERKEGMVSFVLGYMNDVQLNVFRDEKVVKYTSNLNEEPCTINLMRKKDWIISPSEIWYVNINEFDWIHYESISKEKLPLHLGVHSIVDKWVEERLR